ERILAEGKDVGIMLIPLDARLQPLGGIHVPLDHIPPTSGERRGVMEALARSCLPSAAGYVAAAEVWRAPDDRFTPTEHPDREEAVHLQAETRAGDLLTRMCRIIRRDGAPVTLDLMDQSRESPPGLFSRLLDVADAMPEKRCVDDRLLQTAMAAHAET